jgi:hypothetical protein
MKSKKTNMLPILGISVLLIVGAGCDRVTESSTGRMTKSSTGSVTIAGRQITYSIDGPASIAGTDPLIVKFGSHKLERQGGNFLLDGRNIGGIGGADRIDLVVSNSILTVSSGNNTLTIPVGR